MSGAMEEIAAYVRRRMAEASSDTMHACCKRHVIDELLDLEGFLQLAASMDDDGITAGVPVGAGRGR